MRLSPSANPNYMRPNLHCVRGTAESLGVRCWQGMTGRVFDRLGIKDGVGLVETGVEGSSRSVDVLVIR
jgi:hypothetical protein